MNDQILDFPEDNFVPEYAGFWIRFAAAFIDGIIISIPYYILLFASGASESSMMMLIVQLAYLVLNFTYYPYFESSESMATPGKKAMGIKVTDVDGNRVSFGKAFVRNLGKIISAIIFLVGYIMAAFTDKKQALHDIIAKCLVVKA